jgi:nucleoside-diphosphate-sugar epimerase
MKSALITGSSGFVGRYMHRELVDRGYEVVDVDLVDGGDALVTFKHSDRRFDLVVHAAATAPYRSAIDNVPGTFVQDMQLDAAMFNWAIRTRQYHVLYLSSSAAYPIEVQNLDRVVKLAEDEIDLDYPEQPDGNYGWTKLTGERMARAARACDIPITVVRPFSGYGEDQSPNWPFGAFVQRVRNGESPVKIWGDSGQTRDWIHISDVVKGALAVVDARTDDPEPVNLCTGHGTTMGDLVDMMMKTAGYAPFEQRYLVDKTAPMGVMHRVGDPSRMYEFYEPKVTLEEGIARALRDM